VNGVPEILTFYNGMSSTVGKSKKIILYYHFNSFLAAYQSTTKTFTNNCDEYYFVYNYNGGSTYRYPQEGYFLVTDGTVCNVNWVKKHINFKFFFIF
jgi:hypothetical protein